MISKNQIKDITSLQKKKFRTEFKSFVIEGDKLVLEAFDSDYEVVNIFATKNWLNENFVPKTIETIEVTKEELNKISSLSTPPDVLAVLTIHENEINTELISNSLSIILDNINDPGNLGTIIRLADWYGIENIICSQETVDVFNPKVVQSSMGSIFRVKVHYKNLSAFLKEFENIDNFEAYGAFLEGENIYSTDLNTKGFIVLGSESHGISTEIEKFVSKKITIPKAKSSKTESLNVAISAAVICSEFYRKIFINT